MLRKNLLILLAATALATPCAADEIRVAVASNFRYAIEDIAPRFERQIGHDLTLIFGSTGKHFAQIENGAPFDVFLAADERRPRMLEEDGLAVSGSRFVYAIGKLVLWSADPERIDGNEALLAGDFRFLAIANPTLAPYGRAARQALVNLGIWQRVYPQIVRGENVAQTYQYVVSGNADIGLIALAQIRIPDAGYSGSHWEVPGDLYEPIRQQAALVNDTPATRAFWEYLRSEEALAVIRSYGYDTP
ncbi:MAG: molybdate ABC transporter substrate-binding protein [Gammaproteobacteria bacterium]|nr:molybdate ABC transporter substrate-binding protein [Gammaproteobacteria bacterium]